MVMHPNKILHPPIIQQLLAIVHARAVHRPMGSLVLLVAVVIEDLLAGGNILLGKDPHSVVTVHHQHLSEASGNPQLVSIRKSQSPLSLRHTSTRVTLSKAQ
eukprot:2234081-Pyramimonas_sp.AAC.1